MTTDERHYKEYTASNMLVECLNSYSTDIVSTKYPHPMDGLKKIYRRILFCLGTQTDKDAMTALIGDTSKLHQGGDSSIYSAIVRMSQAFSVGEPLIHCFGNYGNYSKPNSAGHARYLELASSEFSRDVFFNGVHRKAIPMTYSKDFRRMEPLYFIPRVPMGLYLNNITIGYGFKSVTPQLNFASLCDMVMMQAEQNGSVPSNSKLARHMIPDYPSHQWLINHEDLINSYKLGNFEHPIDLSGMIEIGPRTIKIRTLPFGTIPDTIVTSVIKKLQSDKNFWLHTLLKDINDYGSNDDYWEFVLEFKNNVDIWKYLDSIKRLFQVDDTMHPIYNFGYDGKITHLDPPDLMGLWYDGRYKSITAGIKSKQTELQLELLKLSAYLVVCDHTDKVIDICTTSHDEDEIIKRLSVEFETLTRMQGRILANAKLTSLAKQSRVKLLLDIEKTESELTDTSAKYSQIHNTIYEDAQFLKKKYSRKRKTITLNHMIGSLHINDRGIIQYSSIDELLDLLQKFKNQSVVIYHDNTFYPHFLSYADNKLLPYSGYNRPKEYAATSVLRSPIKNPYIGLFIEDSFAITNIVKFLDREYRMIPTTREFYGITILGELIKSDISEHSYRKSITKGAKSKFISLIPGNCNNAVVLYMNKAVKNELRFSRICYDGKVGSLTTIPNNETVIVDVIPFNSKDIYLSIPEGVTEFVAYKHLNIPDLSSIMKTDSLVVLDMNRQNPGYSLKKHPEFPGLGVLTSKK